MQWRSRYTWAAMTNDVLKYTPKMDKDLVEIVETSEVAIRITKPNGSMNHVFKVETDRGAIVARIFAKKDFPDCRKLLWIHKTLLKKNIDVPKILYCSKGQTPFRYGFMLMEYVEGVSGWTAMREGKIALDEYFVRLGEILRRVHDIKITGSAPIKATHPKGQYQWFKPVVKDLAAKVGLSNEVGARIQDFVIDTHSVLPRFKNVLCHCDVGPRTDLYPDGSIVLSIGTRRSGSLFRFLIVRWIRKMRYLERRMSKRFNPEGVFKGYGSGFYVKDRLTLIMISF